MTDTPRADAAPSPPPPDRPLEPLAAAMTPDRILPYATRGERTLGLHVFLPPGHAAADRRPAFVLFHGGGWTGRTPRYFYPFASHAAGLGMVGISAEYRLLDPARGGTVFDAVRDARSALRFVRRHAEALGVDPGRLVAGGGSAGGHLAAGTALFDGVDDPGDDLTVPCRPDALALYYPVIDTSPAGYGAAKIGPRWAELSPVERVRPGLPPTLLLHGTGDTVTPFAGAERFHARMREAGNVCELISHPGGRHGYFLFELALFAAAMAQTADFLRRHGLLDGPPG